MFFWFTNCHYSFIFGSCLTTMTIPMHTVHLCYSFIMLSNEMLFHLRVLVVYNSDFNRRQSKHKSIVSFASVLFCVQTSLKCVYILFLQTFIMNCHNESLKWINSAEYLRFYVCCLCQHRSIRNSLNDHNITCLSVFEFEHKHSVQSRLAE